MLHNTTGTSDQDHYKSINLTYQVLEFAEKYLSADGHLLCKYLRGEDEKELINDVNKIFKEVKVVKPKSSRSESKEVYLLAMYRRKDKP